MSPDRERTGMSPDRESVGVSPDRKSAGLSPDRKSAGLSPGQESIRVVVADDQRVVREGLALVLGLLPDVEVVGAAGDGAEAVDLAVALRPDIVLMDLRMPRCDGVEATRRLRERAPEVRVVVLTTYSDDRSVLEALRAGAKGYLTKEAGGEEIQAALRRVLDDGAALDPAVQHHVLNALTRGEPAPAQPAPRNDDLTPREAEVLGLIAGGLTNGQIAARLFISEGTVKSHVNHLLAKLGVRDRAQAVAYAFRNGLAPGE
ncbi:response regulator transcription factor [Dactylosporangium sp. NPDC000244]|uniref:response regulator transcription factor n=1 Tax=Dactylosporangium sp. NPDC000244 TaxID=3154365 RepID=UPI00331DCAD7